MLKTRIMQFARIIGFLVILNKAGSSDVNEPSLSDSRFCDFSKSEKSYSANDLLQCMFELSSKVFGKENRITIDGKPQINSLYDGKKYQQLSDSVSTGRGITDFLASLISAGTNSAYEQPSFISNAIASYYQTNYPAAANLNGASGPLSALNLYDALYSISMYDDLKCVPRILCEVASGSPPTDTLYRKSPNTLQDFGKNALFGLLSIFDTTGSSPLLTFGKAAFLGFTSRDQPHTCYQEYPKCPRSPDQLIHYLNNHNGGFFRFFNKYRDRFPVGQHHQRPYPQKPSGYYGRSDDFTPVRLLGPESDRTGTGEIKFDLPLPSARRYRTDFFPRQRDTSNGRNFAFPTTKEKRIRVESTTSKVLTDVFKLRIPKDVPFFPEETNR